MRFCDSNRIPYDCSDGSAPPGVLKGSTKVPDSLVKDMEPAKNAQFAVSIAELGSKLETAL